MAASVPGQIDGAGAGSAPGPTTQRPTCQAILWQSATATRAVWARVASTSKSTQTTAQSPPSVALTSPIRGVALRASSGALAAERPAAVRKSAMAVTPDQVAAVGPPGAAQLSMTARAPPTLPESRAAVSMPASWARAPAAVWAKPVGTPAGPAVVPAGSTMKPGSRVDNTEGCASSAEAGDIKAAARSSRRTRCTSPGLVGAAVDPGDRSLPTAA